MLSGSAEPDLPKLYFTRVRTLFSNFSIEGPSVFQLVRLVQFFLVTTARSGFCLTAIRVLIKIHIFDLNIHIENGYYT
jgi:hypothetical protein